MAKRVTRAVVLLDQASGALRMDDDEVVGLDFRPDMEQAAQAAGIEIIVGVPGGDALQGMADFSDFAGSFRILPLPELHYLSPDGVRGLTALSGDEAATALVTGDRRMRGEARAAGMAPAPHAALLPMLAAGDDIRAARVVGPKGALEQLQARGDVVPMQFQPVPGDAQGWALIGLFTEDALISAVMTRLSLTPLDYDALTDDLVWARIDNASNEVREALRGRRIHYAEPGQVLLALGPDEDAQALHIHGGHGHAEVLTPDPGLMRGPLPAGEMPADLPVIADQGRILEQVERRPLDVRIWRWIRPSCDEVTAHYKSDLARYTGTAPLDAAGPIESRHSAHPDNKRAEAQLLADLRGMGYCAYRHDFTHAGATHSNIIADLPGQGHLRIRPEILKRYRRILRQPVIDRRTLPLDRDIGPLPDAGSLAALPDPILRRKIEEILVLRPWYPWWKLLCPVPGIGADLVIAGAHMDSTAGFDHGYSAAHDAAPGCDDNASGTAAILSLARYFAGWRGRLTHTIRFCFFNAEESGLVGSKAYASHLKAMGAPVRAVYCLDMIGHNSDANRLFELHAGYTDPAVRNLSDPLAQEVAAAASAYGALAPAQIYRGTGYGGAPDRDIYDGAINRSDHAAFHQQGWGAVLGSEDFFVNLATEPGADPNPDYHRQSDQTIDLAYARDITCAFAKAIKDKAL